MPQTTPAPVDRDLILLAEDDSLLGDMLTDILVANGLKCRTYNEARPLLEDMNLSLAGCVITDIRMPGMDGLDLQLHLAETQPCLPVMLMTGHAEISMAVQAIKNGAFDFLEKPVTPAHLVERVRDALAYGAQRRRLHATRETLEDRFSRLTTREHEILAEIAAGKAAKESARSLVISARTVEHHRARIIEKLGVSGVNELIHLYARWQLLAGSGQ